jgi:hypothetical protein
MIRICLCLVFLFTANVIEATDRIPSNIINSYCRQVQREKDWRLEATGSVNLDPGIQCKTLGFRGSQLLTLEQARSLFVEETEKLLAQLNKKNSQNTPFTIRNVDYGVGFEYRSCQYRSDIHVAHIFSSRNRVVYQKYDSLSEQLVTIHEETYDEALAIVQGKVKFTDCCGQGPGATWVGSHFANPHTAHGFNSDAYQTALGVETDEIIKERGIPSGSTSDSSN